MATIYYEKDTDPSILSADKIAVLGFGTTTNRTLSVSTPVTSVVRK